ncbi:MAG: DUF881 domain-containing protein [Syntrophomonadaceae bacterium]|nr:DUF881 domain-containing protein [Syntrophomonadaceae bacterium]
MRDKTGAIAIAVICVIVGIMLSVQYRTSESYGTNLRTSRVEDLAMANTSLTKENQDLRDEILELREKLANVNIESELTANLQGELRKSNMAAGLTAVIGPGIIVTLNDNPQALQPGDDPNAYLVHDRDILNIVNEIKASGAEAISVNDQRITAMSEVRCAGTTILVNWNKIGPPFVIKAIGNQQLLESGLTIKGGKLEELNTFGLQTQLTRSDNIEIPAYTGAIKFQYTTAKQK